MECDGLGWCYPSYDLHSRPGSQGTRRKNPYSAHDLICMWDVIHIHIAEGGGGGGGKKKSRMRENTK